MSTSQQGPPRRGWYNCSRCGQVLQDSFQEKNWHWDNYAMTIGKFAQAWNYHRDDQIICMKPCWNYLCRQFDEGHIDSPPWGYKDSFRIQEIQRQHYEKQRSQEKRSNKKALTSEASESSSSSSSSSTAAVSPVLNLNESSSSTSSSSTAAVSSDPVVTDEKVDERS